MSDLCALRIVDANSCDYVRVARTDDAFALSRNLSDGHLFPVSVVALYPGRGCLLEEIQQKLPGHVRSSWYTSASDVAMKVAEAVVKRTWPPSPASSLSTVKEEDSDASAVLFTVLEPCENAHADRATLVKRSLSERYGKADAKLISSRCKEMVLTKPSGGKQRVIQYNGQSLRLKR